MNIKELAKGYCSSEFVLRLAAGLGIGFWGISKLIFANDWVGPYQGVFYAALPQAMTGAFFVYVLGVVQVALGAAIIAEFNRTIAAWIAAAMALISLVATTVAIGQAGLASLPGPTGVKLVWLFFNPIAVLLLLVSAALLPEKEEKVKA